MYNFYKHHFSRQYRFMKIDLPVHQSPGYQEFFNRIDRFLLNHQPAIFYFEEDKLATCQIMDVEGERIKNIYFMRNPDKLSVLEKELSMDMHTLQSGR